MQPVGGQVQEAYGARCVVPVAPAALLRPSLRISIPQLIFCVSQLPDTPAFDGLGVTEYERRRAVRGGRLDPGRQRGQPQGERWVALRRVRVEGLLLGGGTGGAAGPPRVVQGRVEGVVEVRRVAVVLRQRGPPHPAEPL